MKFIDLFAGIGGFHYGIKQARPDAECVYSNEWDKYANSVYRKHFGECDYRDIRLVRAYDIPDHDLLCGGFPCQSFSVAGKRGGFTDTRGTLFFEIARILKQKQPRLCLLENVKGLLSHDEGRTFTTIINTLDELGYDLQWQVLNSKNHGVPQNRERIFIVGHLRGTRRPEVFCFRQDAGLDDKTQPKKKQEIHRCLEATEYKGISSERFTGIQDTIRPDQQDTFNKRNKSNSTNSIRRTTYTNDMHIRRLTPVECERLQGFPDNWTKYGADGELISDTQRYKMCGNAVTTSVISAIIERMYP